MSYEHRDEKVLRYISESRAEMQLEPLDGVRLKAAVKTWLDRLDRIPDSALDECYALAMERHTRRQAVIPQQLLESWTSVRMKPEMVPTKPKKECPLGCSEAGFIIVDAHGKPLIEYGSNMRYEGYTYVKSCPYHRQAGIGESVTQELRNAGPVVEKLETSHVPSKGYAGAEPSGWKAAGAVAAAVAPTPKSENEDGPPF